MHNSRSILMKAQEALSQAINEASKDRPYRPFISVKVGSAIDRLQMAAAMLEGDRCDTMPQGESHA